MSSLGLETQNTTYLQNGLAFDINGVNTPYGKGVYVPPICVYTAVPRLQTDGFIVPVGSAITAGVPLPLNPANVTMYNGELVVVLDCARNITILPSAAITNTTTFTVTGYDINFKPLTSSITVNAGQSNALVPSAFLMVSSVTPSATNPQTVNVRQSNSGIGLPFFLRSRGDIISMTWDNATLALTTVTPGFDWRATGVVSATTIDANGSVALSPFVNSVRTFSITYYCYGADTALNTKIQNEVNGEFPYAVTLYTTGSRIQISTNAINYARVRRNASNTQYVYPSLVEQDLIGPRFPTDSAFLTKYAAALAT